ncbi:sugar ABC transporter permease [Oceanobacillus caeni]|uniref:ABC transporter permease n=1 Tax=Oceanobacillus caeni TaxID=405946 RepID=A0ABR5ML51_9BACI|nr:sugar ABC transporter permease [Oceanobacillus caeni]KKE79709.1 ABC transporter permease [Bacilli bacterium VT-13-104]PZD89576.1 sugar ABC transporter permease [Bacilli bacterium]KPH76661.1 ABC transporter permease [Oceanobacillus caeni]MCR1833330.1 sugar ABC transporter permease [Oceanobacillus caeni]PZD91098.1 sugar ABC transporter permease [Bacilli bacterium]
MKNRSVSFWLFLTPTLLSLALVVFVPFIYGFFYSFTDWNGLKATEFMGLANYAELFQDEAFLSSIWFTIKFAVASIILVNIIGLGLALLVTQKIKSSNILRTVFFMPNLIGGLILGFIWQFIFISAFDAFGNALGIEALSGWLSTSETGFWGMVILNVWQYAGYIMIIYIAYLESVPEELLEAAEMDGANSFKRFWNVKFPLVAPAFTISLFLTLSNAFKLYDQNLALTNGGPFRSTEMVAMNIYNSAFKEYDMAYAQAKAVIFFILVAVVALTQVYYNKKREVDL